MYLCGPMGRLAAPIIEFVTKISRGRLEGEISKLRPPLFSMVNHDFYFDTTKAKELLNYTPLYTLDEALHRIKWYYAPILTQNKRRN